MSKLTIKWHTMLDERVCPICGPLEGETWDFETRVERFPNVLVGPGGQVVWDCIADEPRTHGAEIWNCRCKLTWNFDCSDIKNTILEMLGTVETWKNVGEVLVLREAGRFVAWRRMG